MILFLYLLFVWLLIKCRKEKENASGQECLFLVEIFGAFLLNFARNLFDFRCIGVCDPVFVGFRQISGKGKKRFLLLPFLSRNFAGFLVALAGAHVFIFCFFYLLRKSREVK